MDVEQLDEDTFCLASWAPSPPLPRVLARTLGSVWPVLRAASMSVALVEGRRTLRFVAAAGPQARGIIGVAIPTDRGIAGWAVTTGQAITVSDVDSDARFAREVAESAGYVPTRITAVPLYDGDEPAGVLELLDLPPEAEVAPDGGGHVGRLSSALTETVTALRGDAHLPEEVREAVDALTRLADVDPGVASHVAALLQALAPSARSRRR